jgi:hypothetical protein
MEEVCGVEEVWGCRRRGGGRVDGVWGEGESSAQEREQKAAGDGGTPKRCR